MYYYIYYVLYATPMPGLGSFPVGHGDINEDETEYGTPRMSSAAEMYPKRPSKHYPAQSRRYAISLKYEFRMKITSPPPRTTWRNRRDRGPCRKIWKYNYDITLILRPCDSPVWWSRDAARKKMWRKKALERKIPAAVWKRWTRDTLPQAECNGHGKKHRITAVFSWP